MTSIRSARGGVRTKVLATVATLGLVGVLAGYGTWSAFSSTTANAGNSFAAGTVVITDDDANSAMFALTNLKPGEPGSAGAKCIKVTYSGSLPANVRLYGSTASGTLGSYLTLKVTRGTIATPSFPSCTGFVADTTEYLGVGLGAGVVYDGNLSAFPGAWASGIQYPASTWSNGSSATYRFELTVQDANAAQGLSASGVTFTWEAQNA